MSEYCKRPKMTLKGSPGERRCREVAEEFWGIPFPCAKPSWLVKPGAKESMEIDCYCEQLRICIEYDGRYHNNSNQRRRDKAKNKICEQYGFILIRVNCREVNKVSQIRAYLTNIFLSMPSKEVLLEMASNAPAIN